MCDYSDGQLGATLVGRTVIKHNGVWVVLDVVCCYMVSRITEFEKYSSAAIS